MKLSRHKGSRLLGLVPWVTLALFLAPVLAGLAATALPAFGYLPALGGEHFNLSSWQRLVAVPGLATAAGLSLWTGLLATLLTVILVFGFCSAMHDTPLFRKSQVILSPLLATPHVALAIGLAFLIAPSGWLIRILSPWLTGWTRPPDLAMVNDSLGLALVVGLLIKEVPFVLLMTLSALNQIATRESLLTARSLGYPPMTAWLKVVLPQIYAQIRLPVYAVLAFSMSVVDVAVVLAPTTPPPLSVMVFRMFMDRDLTMIFPAAAGACLQFLLVAAAIGFWRVGEILVAQSARPWMLRGHRKQTRPPLYYAWGGLVIGLVTPVRILGTLALGLWSFARTWFYPLALPSSWTLAHWLRHLPDLAGPTLTTLLLRAGRRVPGPDPGPRLSAE
jgi:putative thiamine transport system permease protein